MEKEVKSKKTEEKRIIKRNWLKISIITFIVLVILIGISVGIYFIVKSTQKNEYEVKGVNMDAKIKDVRNDILDSSDRNAVGIFFYQQDESVANYLMTGDVDTEVENEGNAVLKTFMEEEVENGYRTWYGIKIDDNGSELLKELFVEEVEDDVYKFYDQFEPLYNTEWGNIDETWYFESLDGGNDDPLYDISNSKSDIFKVDVVEDTGTLQKTVDGSTFEDWSIVSGTTMFFTEQGELETIINSWLTPPTQESDSENDGQKYSNNYRSWLEQIEDRYEF